MCRLDLLCPTSRLVRLNQPGLSEIHIRLFEHDLDAQVYADLSTIVTCAKACLAVAHLEQQDVAEHAIRVTHAQ